MDDLQLYQKIKNLLIGWKDSNYLFTSLDLVNSVYLEAKLKGIESTTGLKKILKYYANKQYNNSLPISRDIDPDNSMNYFNYRENDNLSPNNYSFIDYLEMAYKELENED